ncbi:hypothetical protein [Acidianus sp. RZ1]|uniref:hypothetical protein n=1 Tax=Acidianus sp. RZ1 TaxID=1540082 RepID=UPI001491EB22|nr:hypothetical protein [Acidianus sp. RZ1]NON63525.1 hypothetical protein [Acidianus sp. RZ1]
MMVDVLPFLIPSLFFIFVVEFVYKLSARGVPVGYLLTRGKEYIIIMKEGQPNGQPNGYTYNGFFTKAIVLTGGIDPEILVHEEGHTMQPNPLYVSVLPFTPLIHYNIYVSVALMVITYKLLVYYYERRADIYAYAKYGIKYKAEIRRPASRWERLKEWAFDTHAPDWVREREEYYQKNVWLLSLFWQDITA